MDEALRPRTRSAQRIPSGEKSPRVMTALPDPLAFRDEEQLTTDEMTTLRLMASGLTLREIQGRLDVGYRVVQRHRDGVFRKLRARNEANAVYKAFERGVISY